MADVQSDLERTGADLKIVDRENIHLTLRFLGNVSESRLELIKDVVREFATIDPFRIRVEGLGVFPKPSFIRVIWAGVTKGEDELKFLRRELDQKLTEIDYPPEEKEFTPHYTIARMKSGRAKDKVLSLIRGRSGDRFGSIEVDEIKLKKSELTSQGPVYTALETVELVS